MMQIEVKDEAVNIIETFTGMKVQDYLDKTSSEMILHYETNKRIAIKEAASLMGTSEQFIRVGLQQGQFPFGVAIKISSRYTYHISPKRFYDYIGYIPKE